MKKLVSLVALIVLFAGIASAQIIGPGGGGGSGTVSVGTGLTGNGSAGSPVALATPVVGANGGLGIGVASGTVLQPVCNVSGSSGPSSANEMQVFEDWIPVPVGFPNGKMAYFAGTGDATAESDVCVYSCGTAGTTCTLLADTGLIAISTSTVQLPALGGGTSNIIPVANCTGLNAPAECCTGAGTGPTCITAGQPTSTAVYPAGYYATAFASVTTTAKLSVCSSNAGALNIVYTNSTISAPLGQCPPTFTSTLSPINGQARTFIFGW